MSVLIHEQQPLRLAPHWAWGGRESENAWGLPGSFPPQLGPFSLAHLRAYATPPLVAPGLILGPEGGDFDAFYKIAAPVSRPAIEVEMWSISHLTLAVPAPLGASAPGRHESCKAQAT